MRHLTRISLLGLLLAFAPGIWSATPGEGTVTDDDPATARNESVTEWTGGPYIFPNITPQTGEPAICADYTVTCDEYFFEVNLTQPVDVENDQVKVSIGWELSDADYDPYLYDAVTGDLLVNGAGSNNPEVMFVPARNGSFNGKYRVVIAPFLPIAQTYAGRVEFQKFVDEGRQAQAKAAVLGNTRFDVFNPVAPFTGYSASEPTMGIDRNTNKTYMIYSSQYLETAFDDATSPATATWKDVTGNGAPLIQFDPFMADDEHPFADGSYNPRIWAVGFGLAASDMLFSDTPGNGTWTRTNTAALGLPAGVDNESIASGPYPDTTLGNALEAKSLASGGKGHAFYYCAHGGVNAFCIRSDDGGLTYNTGRPIFPSGLSCSNHGHVKVGPDGTVYVPMNLACTGGQGVSVSLDAGETWTYIRVPDDTAAGSGRWDSSIGLASDGKTLYYGYMDQEKDEPWIVRGTLSKVAGTGGVLKPQIEWGKPTNVGRFAGLRNIVFPTVVAGDPDRAAFAFHGSTAEGDSGDPNFKGTWHMYVALTYDGGATWQLNNINPSDPTQKGGVCDRGISCPASPPYRNLLDFMDMVLDRDGRVVVGHADGCLRNCITPNGRPTYSDMGALARQAGGKPLFAAKDALFQAKSGDEFATAAPLLTARALYNSVHLSWKAPDNRGSLIEGYRVFRAGSGGTPSLIATLKSANVNAKPYYLDRTLAPGTYTYQVESFGPLGAGRRSAAVTASIARAADTASGTQGDNDRPTRRNDARAEDEESACVPPGITVVEDATGDGLNGTPLHPSEDVEFIAVSEPAALANKIVFTLKVTRLDEPLLPQHRWVVYFTLPDGVEWYVAMSNAEGALRYEYGRTQYLSAGVATAGQFQYVGDLEPESGYTADGHIALVLDKAKVGGLAPGQAVDLIYAKVRDSSASTGAQNAGITRDDTGTGFYEIVGNESCEEKALTVAAMDAYDASGRKLTGATGFTGTAPVRFTFDASPTSLDRNVSVVKYFWNFGDGTKLETTDSRVSHSYDKAEAYRVSLRVLDSTGRYSNSAKLTLLLGEQGSNNGLLNEDSYSIFGGALNGMALLALAGFGALGFRLRRRKV